jgi:hypothetical protein
MNIVYGIKCIVNDKFYIGATSRSHLRKREHFRRLRKGDHHATKLQRAWDKYKEESFVFVILESDINADLLTEREQYWLDFHDAYHNGFNGRSTTCPCPIGEKNGMFGTIPPNKGLPSSLRKPVCSYCINTGEVEYFEFVAQVSKIHPHIGPQFLGCITPDKIEKNHYCSFHGKFWFYISDFNIINLKSRFIEKNKPSALIGRKRSEEVRKKISKRRMGMKFSKTHIKNMSISKMGLNNKSITRSDGVIFESIKAAAKAIECDPSQISHQLYGYTKTCRGFSFTFTASTG